MKDKYMLIILTSILTSSMMAILIREYQIGKINYQGKFEYIGGK